MLSKNQIEEALSQVADVFGDGDIVSRNRVQNISTSDGRVNLTLSLPIDDAGVRERVEDECRRRLKGLSGVEKVTIMTRASKPNLEATGSPGPQPSSPGPGAAPGQSPFDPKPIEGVRHPIAVSSAKGEVGKSTIAVNLALALARQGAKVGLMDADVYGPSLHVLLGVTKRPHQGRNKQIAPLEKHGLKLMSVGFIAEMNDAMMWRGPIVTQVLRTFLHDVDWEELDYLIVDMPPGTGDAQLTLAQTVELSGAIICTTPSVLALADVERGYQAFEKVETRVLGIVENMAYFVDPGSGNRTDIFGKRAGPEMAKRLGTEFLVEIPVDPEVRASGDEGEPIVVRDPGSEVSKAFMQLANRVRELCP